jgi:hypothetical protein
LETFRKKVLALSKSLDVLEVVPNNTTMNTTTQNNSGLTIVLNDVARYTITLKSFKTVKWMSEETVCFTAQVLINGTVYGEASNEGHGGCTFVHYKTEVCRGFCEDLAKAAKPSDYGWDFAESLTFDNLIDILVERLGKAKANASILKKVKKDLADKVVFVKAGECPKQGYRILKCGAAGIAKGIEAMKAKYGNITIYNGLDDASLTAAFCL